MKFMGIVGTVILAAAIASLPASAKKKDKAEAAAKAPAADVVAYVGDEAVTKDELDKAAAGQLMRLKQQEFEILQNALDGIIQNKLLDKEAAARKVTVEALLKTEVEDKTQAPTKEEIDAFYDRNKPRMGNRTREDAGPDIERQLKGQKQNERRAAFLGELLEKSPIKVLLEPPRVAVKFAEDAPAMGPAAAPVTIVEYSDYQCPFCRRAQPTVDQIKKEYGDKVRLVYRDYPLSFHKQAFPASVAARCAGDQGKFWEYHNNLMTVNGDLGPEDLKKRATDLGLDATAFAACSDSKRHDAAIQAAFDEGASYGVTGTPAFFINGRMVVGAQPFDKFKEVIDDELARATTATK